MVWPWVIEAVEMNHKYRFWHISCVSDDEVLRCLQRQMPLWLSVVCSVDSQQRAVDSHRTHTHMCLVIIINSLFHVCPFRYFLYLSTDCPDKCSHDSAEPHWPFLFHRKSHSYYIDYADDIRRIYMDSVWTGVDWSGLDGQLCFRQQFHAWHVLMYYSVRCWHRCKQKHKKKPWSERID